MLIFTVFVLLSLVFSGSSIAMEGKVEIRGNNHGYAIPDRYVKQGLDTPWLRGLAGDESPVKSIIVPLNDVGLEGIDDEDLRMILFYDKDYAKIDQDFSFLLQDTIRKTGASTDYIVFYEKIRNDDSERYFFFTYEPGEEIRDEGDYDVRMAISKPITIGEFQSNPRPSCQMSLVRDGILVQVSFLGSLCSEEHFERVVAAVDRMMARWRTDKPA